MNQNFLNIILEEASKVGTDTLPNPKVGAIVVRDNRIIGKGHTEFFGGLHAEVKALQDAGNGTKGAELYCTLEPCYGTWAGKHNAPCTEYILSAGIKRVHILCTDPNPNVRGKGIAYLRSKRIDVVMHPAYELKARMLNEAYEYLQYHPQKPFMHLKIAQSLDAKMTGADCTRIAITDEIIKKEVYNIRIQHVGIVTGVSTITIDDPLFTVRGTGVSNTPSPALVILDTMLRTLPTARIFSCLDRTPPAHGEKGIIILSSEEAVKNTVRKKLLESAGAQVFVVNTVHRENAVVLDLKHVCQTLLRLGLYSVMVEAGPTLASALLQEQLIDKVSFYIAPIFLNQGVGLGNFSRNNSAITTLYHVRQSTFNESDNIGIVGYTQKIF